MAKTVAVVGGGAAGLAAAIAAGRALQARGEDTAAVTIYEDDDRVGRSILATGNGRCNFSNAHIDTALYRNGDFVACVLDTLERRVCDGACAAGDAPFVGASSEPNAVLRFFASCGLAWREEGQGRLYPVTNKASTVLDVLRAAARVCGVEEHCGNAVRSIEPPREPGGRFTLRMADGAFERADAVVVAVGGRYGIDLLPDGVEVAPFSPVLGPLKTDVTLIRALDNIRVRCEVSLRRGGAQGAVLACERGEVLFRKYGVSGIAAFNLSRYAEPGDDIVIDLFADSGRLGDDLPAAGDSDAHADAHDVSAMLIRRRDTLVACGLARTCGEVLRGLLLPLVAEAVCKAAGVSLDDAPSDDALARIARAASGFVLRVEGAGDARQCQVHRGGVAPGAVDPATMEVCAVPGLHLAGEMIDTDAPCGGYNLHWAWASGLLAGASAAKAIMR